MELHEVVAAIAEDLRRAGEIGGDETASVAARLAAAVEPTLRLRLIEVVQAAAREVEATAQGLRVEVRIEGRDPVIAATLTEGTDGGEGPADTRGFGDGELVRLTIRLPEGLKAQVEHVAAVAGASINSWIVAALSRALESPTSGRAQTSRRMPRRITGIVQG